jgi:hypothetical protein
VGLHAGWSFSLLRLHFSQRRSRVACSWRNRPGEPVRQPWDQQSFQSAIRPAIRPTESGRIPDAWSGGGRRRCASAPAATPLAPGFRRRDGTNAQSASHNDGSAAGTTATATATTATSAATTSAPASSTTAAASSAVVRLGSRRLLAVAAERCG